MISVRTLVKTLAGADERCPCCGNPKVCVCCGGTEAIRPHSPWHWRDIICIPCFLIWYDNGLTDSAEIGAESLRLKALGKFPWDGTYPRKAA